MTIIVIGAGAIGLCIAGRLARCAQRVVVLARPSTAARLAQQPLQITQKGWVEHVPGLAVISEPTQILPADRSPELAILAVKGYDTIGALPALERLAPNQILTLQNGLGNEELLAGRFGPPHVISGTITTSVELDSPRQITVTKVGGIGLAPLDAQTDIGRWAGMFRGAGFIVRTYQDYRAMKWSKLLLNMLGNATAAILDMPVAEVYADSRLRALERQAFLEALHVMDRMGIRPVNLPRYPVAVLAAAMRWLPSMLLDPLLRHLIAGGRGGKPPSLHTDLARGNRRSEGAFLYGAVAAAAEQAGIGAPVNDHLWRTLRAIAQGEVAWSEYQRRPDRLLQAIRHPEHCGMQS